jgi:hypothetical protein
MNTIIKKLRKQALQTYTFSDIYGDNNYGIELIETSEQPIDMDNIIDKIKNHFK